MSDYFAVLLRHKLRIGAVMLVCCLAALVWCALARPVYRARASLEILPFNEKFLNVSEVDPTAVHDGAEYMQTQLKLLTSDSLINRTVKKVLRQIDAAQPAVRRPEELWRFPALAPLLPERHPIPGAEELGAAEQNLGVRGSGFNRIVEIRFAATDPNLAAVFANTLAQEYIEYNLEARWTSTQHTSQWLSEHLGDLRARLQSAEQRMQTYAEDSNLVFSQAGEINAYEKLKLLQTELAAAQADRIAKQSNSELAAAMPAEAVPDVLSDAAVRDYRAKLTELRRQKAELDESLAPAHPKIRRLDAQIAELAQAVEVERTAIVTRIRNEYDAARRREALLEAAYADQARRVSEQARRAMQYNLLKSEVESTRQLYDSLQQKVKEAGIAAALRASNIRIVDAAVRPGSPSSPNIRVSCALGLLCGAFLGVLWAFDRERRDRRLRFPSQLAPLNLPELGVIPSAHEILAIGNGRAPVLQGLQRTETPAHPQTRHKRARRMSLALAETFNSTLTSVLFASQGNVSTGWLRVVALTSPGPGEGKTTMSAHLAVAAASTGKRVLLVDGDMRKPGLHLTLGLENGVGLTDLLVGNEPLEECAGPLLKETPFPQLHFLNAGRPESDVWKLLHSPRVAEVLGWLRQRYELVFLDTPPLSIGPDARILGHFADATILVLRAGKTQIDAAIAAKRRLQEDGIHVLGTILNDWKTEDTSRTYGYYYYGSEA